MGGKRHISKKNTGFAWALVKLGSALSLMEVERRGDGPHVTGSINIDEPPRKWGAPGRTRHDQTGHLVGRVMRGVADPGGCASPGRPDRERLIRDADRPGRRIHQLHGR